MKKQPLNIQNVSLSQTDSNDGLFLNENNGQ